MEYTGPIEEKAKGRVSMEQNNMPRLCRNCGAPLNAGEKFCTSCGSPVQQQNPYQQPGCQQNANQQPVRNYGENFFNPSAARGMTKQEYRKACTNKKYLSQIRTAAIFAYVSVGLTLVMMLLTQSFWSLIDIAIVLPLAIILQTKKSKGCAIGLLVYAIICVVTNIIVSQTFGGWLWLITSISAVRAFSTPDKEYEAAKMYL